MGVGSPAGLDASPPRLLIGVLALMWAPVVAHGLWRPLLAAIGGAGAGIAPRVTVAALVMAAVGMLAPRWVPGGRAGSARATGLLGLALGFVLGGALPMALALAAAGVATALLGLWCLERVPAEVAGLLARRGWRYAWVALCAAVVAKGALLATFMGDPAYTRASLVPREPFLVHHSCLTAYVNAAALHRAGVANVYAAALVPACEASGTQPGSDPRFAPFRLDRYLYPPPFLLVPMALGVVTDGFLAQRALWYGVNGLLVAAALWVAARWVGGRRGAMALLLAPAVWITWGYALQLGNAHSLVAALSVLALVAFARNRPALGGTLLSAAALTKIAPALLGVLLLFRRRWGDAAWTFAAGAIVGLVGLLVLGPRPYAAFFGDLLPRLGAGEAQTFAIRDARAIAANYGVFAIPFKLALLGLDLDPWALARRLTGIYTVLLVGLAFLGARRSAGRGPALVVWLSLLTLAALRSDLAPPYVLSTLFWLVALRLGELRSTRGTLGLLAATLLTLAPALPGPPARLAGLSLAAQAAVFGLLVWSVVRPPATEPP